jgi:hypothetical protein
VICKGLVIGVQVSRQEVVDVLRRLGRTQAADEASRELPDPVDLQQLETLAMRCGISRDDLISQMGGSP